MIRCAHLFASGTLAGLLAFSSAFAADPPDVGQDAEHGGIATEPGPSEHASDPETPPGVHNPGRTTGVTMPSVAGDATGAPSTESGERSPRTGAQGAPRDDSTGVVPPKSEVEGRVDPGASSAERETQKKARETGNDAELRPELGDKPGS
ncbi:MAG: hypothetical protein QOD06_2432 [Candidatus Binatota bacterium]|nr:hypothetical protein [Candidatus Binatota bacterium]